MEMLRSGTIGPKNCTRSRIPVFQQNFSSDAIDFQDASYLRILRPAPERSDISVQILSGSAAVCFFKGGMIVLSSAYVSMVSSLVLLIYVYAIRAAKTFEGSSRLISQRLQTGLDHWYDIWMGKLTTFLSRRRSTIITIPVLAVLPVQTSIYCTFRVFIHLYTSMFAEV